MQPAEPIANRPIGVWLVDDNDEYTSVMSEALNLSTTVRCLSTFARCEPAFDALRSGDPPPQVLLLDIGLPGISGIEGIETFKQLSPQMQVLMLTVYDMDEKVSAAVRRGASGYLLKTSPPADVIRAVEVIVAGGMPLDPMVTRNLVNSIRPRKAGPVRTYDLTDRELQVLRFLVEGYSFLQIANRMFISPSTVKTHVENINRKLDVHSRGVAVVKALKEGLV